MAIAPPKLLCPESLWRHWHRRSEPNSRLALQLNQFAAVGARGVAVGSAAIASEAETVEAEFIIGRPLEHPACERARRALADKQKSTAWPRLDVSRPCLAH